MKWSSPSSLNSIFLSKVNMFPRSAHHLSQEQHQALTILENHIINKDVQYLQKDDLTFVLATEENGHFFYDGHLSASLIPKKAGWKWNQSRSKVLLISTKEDFKLSFYKLNTRKNGECISKIPHYKIWLFNITNTETGIKTAFFWCERGCKKDPEIIPEVSKIETELLQELEKYVSSQQDALDTIDTYIMSSDQKVDEFGSLDDYFSYSSSNDFFGFSDISVA